MKIQQLRALVAIASSGSINGAAKALHVTQPAVTKAMQELEADFGVRLLERNPRGVVPTAEGEVLLRRAKTVVRELERAQEEMAQIKGAREGTLVIGITPIAGTAGMTEAFIAFRRHWPLVKVEFRELGFNQLNEQLRNRTLDLAFGAFSKPPTVEAGTVKELVAFETTFVTRAGSAYADAASLEALQSAEWIHTDVTDAYPAYVEAMYRASDLAPPLRITRYTSFALFYALTFNTDAVCNWTRHSLESTAQGRTLIALDLPVEPPPLHLYLLSPPAAQLTRPAEYFVHCITQTTRISPPPTF